MRITIQVDSENEAFKLDGVTDMPTIACNLSEIALRIGRGDRAGILRDATGKQAFAFSVEG